MVMGTGDTGLASLMQTYYDKLFLTRLFPQLKYDQFANQKSLPQNAGKIIVWNRLKNIPAGYALTEGTAPGFSAYSAQKVSATLTQLGFTVSISDLFNMTELSDAVKDAVTLLSDGGAKTWDSYIGAQIGFSAGDASVGVANAASATVPSAKSLYFPLLDNSVVRAGTIALNASAISTGLTIARVLDCVTYLRGMDAPPFDDGNYAAIVHPLVADSLMRDTNWATWNAYTNPEAMYQGEIGKIMGVRFVQSTNAISQTYAASAWATGMFSAGGTIYGTLIFGKDAYGVSKMEGGVKLFIVPNDKPDKADPLCQYGTVGYKITGVAQVLNPSCGIIACNYVSN